ncbi:putative integral membrane protein conserved region-domain-containing protein, partial [Mortierella sp. GBAus27b]
MSNILFQPKNARPKDSYYAVLRYDTLFLYESDQQRDCKFVMQMTLHEVKIFPRNLPDNEVFNKEHPIQIKRRASAPASSSVPANSQDEYYIFIHTPVIKEDWFLALLHASRLRKPGMRQVRDKAQFDLQAIQNHLRILHSDKHHEHTRWFNSFLGRIFLGVYKTKRIQEVFIAKIKRKTLKLKRPSFLGEIKVRSFNIGQSIPYITRTKLNELATNGELTAEFHLDYRGGIRVEIEVDVGLGLASLKPVKVTIVLAVLVRSLSGMMTLKIKAPPTNRFWIGFQEPPEMDIVIEPIVADKAIKLNMVINAIETKIREAMVEAIVLPNMDDYPFFDSRGAGGIFEGDEEVPTESVEESDAE